MEIPEPTQIIKETKKGRPVGTIRVIYETKEEKYKKYNSTHYEKHKKEPSIICEICTGKYKYYNKNHHLHSKRHLKKVQEKKDLEKINEPESLI
jgi:hypothetical protein